MRVIRPAWVWAALIAFSLPPSAWCQGSGDTGGDLPQPNNPLQGLFTPQPQYPTAQTKLNPTPSNVSDNPLGGMFTAQPQYPTAQTKMNPLPDAPSSAAGTNPLQGLYTGQPQFPTAQTQLNPQAQPLNQWVSPTMAKEAAEKAATEKAAAEKAAADKAAGEKPTAEAADKDQDKGKESKDKSKTGKAKAKAKGEKEQPKEEKPLVYNPLQEAMFLLNTGEYDKALDSVSKIVKVNPSDGKAHYVRAVILVGMRNYKLAADEYNTVINLVPATPLAQKAAEGLRKIGAPPPSTPKLPPLRSGR